MDRLVSLGVGTKGSEDFRQTFQDLSELAANLGESHGYVTVSGSFVGDDDSAELEVLHYDDNTIFKVRDAIYKGFEGENWLTTAQIEAVTTSIINELQNAGILFRERVSE